MFSLPCPAEQGSDRAALVGTWHPARVNPPHQGREMTTQNQMRKRWSRLAKRMRNDVPRIQHNGAGGGPSQAQYGSAAGTAWQGKLLHFSRESAGLGASLKCLYASTRSMGNKHDELEICVQLQGYGLTGITEAWWDSSHDWSAAMEGCRLFRKDRLGRRGRGVVLCVGEQQKHTALPGGG